MLENRVLAIRRTIDEEKNFGSLCDSYVRLYGTFRMQKNVGTPEDNAVVENEDEQAQDTETSEGHTFGYSCIDIYNPYYDVVKESIRGELEAKGDTLVVKIRTEM